MFIVDAEIAQVKTFPPGTSPDYNRNNPIWKLVRTVEATCVYRKPHPVERESESRKLIG